MKPVEEEFPFRHQTVVFAGLSKEEVVFSSPDITLDETGLQDAKYVKYVKERFGLICPSCGDAYIGPREARKTEKLSSYVSCYSCDWNGTKGDIVTKQIQEFGELDESNAYEMRKSFGSVKEFLDTSIGNLKRELPEELDAKRVHNTVLNSTPENMVPEGRGLLDRVAHDGNAVRDGIRAVEDETPYGNEKVRKYVRLSYAASCLDISENMLIQAEDAAGQIDRGKRGGVVTTRDEDLIRQGVAELKQVVEEFLDCHSITNKLEGIVCAKVVFEPFIQRELSNRILSSSVGCTEGYASKFELVCTRPFPIAMKKPYAARREIERIPKGMRIGLLERHDNRCARCESGSEIEVHHIIPVSQGGETCMDNLAPLCKECHKQAHGGSYSSNVVYDDLSGFESWIDDY